MFVGYGGCTKCKRKAGPAELVGITCTTHPLRNVPPTGHAYLCRRCYAGLRTWLEAEMDTTVRRYKKELPTDGETTSFPVDHGLNTFDAHVQLYDPMTGQTRPCPGMIRELDTLTLHFLEAPAADERIVVVVTA